MNMKLKGAQGLQDVQQEANTPELLSQVQLQELKDAARVPTGRQEQGKDNII